MKINLSGHHVDITASIKEHITEKFSKIEKHFPSLISLDVIIGKDHNQFEVELTTNYEGNRVSTKGHHDVMYPAIAQAAKKLDAALKHKKGQRKADLHEKPSSTTPEIAHEIIQEMDLR